MSNNATDELLSYINTILADYAATCGVEPFNGQIIIADDMRKSYLSLRGDESINKGNIDWVGTLVHEATHVNDFKDYYKIVSPQSWDELYEYSLHRTFLHWTEFHARAIGHYFLRKYTLNNF